MKKIVSLVLILLMACLIFASCGDSYSEGSNIKGTAVNPTSDGWYHSENESSDSVGKGGNSAAPAKDSAVVDDSRKIIKTFRIEMEAKDFDGLTATVAAEVAALGGYVSDSTLTGGKNNDYDTVRRATYTVRVPSTKAEAFIDSISGEGNVLRSTLSTDDITDSYFDYKARLDSLTLQEERLLEMLKKATTLDYMLQIEDKLASLRAEINSIYSQIQRMDKSVDYSYIYLSVTEVKEYKPVTEPTYFSKLGEAFVGAFAFFGDFVSTLFLGIVWVLPFLIIAAVVLIFVILPKRRKKAKKEAGKNDSKTL